MLFLWMTTAVEVSDSSVVASYHDISHMVQELASIVTAFQLSKWLPLFQKGQWLFWWPGSAACLSQSLLKVQPRIGFFRPPEKLFSHFIPYNKSFCT